MGKTGNAKPHTWRQTAHRLAAAAGRTTDEERGERKGVREGQSTSFSKRATLSKPAICFFDERRGAGGNGWAHK